MKKRVTKDQEGKTLKPLQLAKETLRLLEVPELRNVAGGASNSGGLTQIWCCHVN